MKKKVQTNKKVKRNQKKDHKKVLRKKIPKKDTFYTRNQKRYIL